MSPLHRCCCTRGGRIFCPTYLLSSYLCISEDIFLVTARRVLLFGGGGGGGNLLSNTRFVRLPMYQDVFDVTATQVLQYQGRENLLSNTPVVRLPMYQCGCQDVFGVCIDVHAQR